MACISWETLCNTFFLLAIGCYRASEIIQNYVKNVSDKFFLILFFFDSIVINSLQYFF